MERGMKGGREGARERVREGAREGASERGRERASERGRERGRGRGREPQPLLARQCPSHRQWNQRAQARGRMRGGHRGPKAQWMPVSESLPAEQRGGLLGGRVVGGARGRLTEGALDQQHSCSWITRCVHSVASDTLSRFKGMGKLTPPALTSLLAYTGPRCPIRCTLASSPASLIARAHVIVCVCVCVCWWCV